jgi:hypothetical protein
MKAIVAATVTVLLSGCSALGSMTNLRAVESTPGWEQRPVAEAKYEHPSFRKYIHRQHALTVTLCASPDTWSILAFGPALVPLIPVGLFMEPVTNWPPSLFMYLQILSPESKASIDFAKIRLRVHGKSEVLAPAEVTRYGSDPRWDNSDVCGRTPDYRVTVDRLQEIAGVAAKFVMRFEVLESEVTACELDLGVIRVGDREVIVPPLSYERTTSSFYVPFVIPPEGKPVGFAVFSGKIMTDSPK